MAENSILIKLKRDGDFIHLTTYSRKLKRQGRFFIRMDKLLDWLRKGMPESFHDNDCGWRLTMRPINFDKVNVEVLWINTDSDRVYGWRQEFMLSVDDLVRLCHLDDAQIRRLYTERDMSKPIRICHHTNPILHDRYVRRAFSKAMRDCFQWRNSNITLYPDAGNNFMFEDDCERCRLVGGLILSKLTRMYGGKPHTCLKYSVHT